MQHVADIGGADPGGGCPRSLAASRPDGRHKPCLDLIPSEIYVSSHIDKVAGDR